MCKYFDMSLELLSIVFLALALPLLVYSEDADDEIPSVTLEEVIMGGQGDEVTTFSSENVSSNTTAGSSAKNRQTTSKTVETPALIRISTENIFKGIDNEKDLAWAQNAIKDIAFFLRAYKFNEYDRRFNLKPSASVVQYFEGFPKPPLRSLHWEVRKFCEPSFLHCIEYLYKRVNDLIFRREDDTSVAINEQKWTLNAHEAQINSVEKKCQKLKEKDEEFALPFQGPLERFQWRTTASYYMCWYTLNEVPNLKHLGEPCDNFAACLDHEFGANNKDPRASDKEPFACALYSFCPDPCCPIRHIEDHSWCWESKKNPCFSENRHDTNNAQCVFKRSLNTDFTDVVLNRWNVTCKCSQPGFIWESKYGMCVDINECTSGEHKCDSTSEFCVNLPGSYKCACNWGYVRNKQKGKCLKSGAIAEIKLESVQEVYMQKQKTKKLSALRWMLRKIFKNSEASDLKHFSKVFLFTIFASTLTRKHQ